MDEGKWTIESKSGKRYIVELALPAICSICIPGDPLQPTCTKVECQFLCRHMYKCDPLCYDFQNGHLCKHVHCVHARHAITNAQAYSISIKESSGESGCSQLQSDDESDVDTVSYAVSCIPLSQGLQNICIMTHCYLSSALSDVSAKLSTFKGYIQELEKCVRLENTQVVQQLDHINSLLNKAVLTCKASLASSTSLQPSKPLEAKEYIAPGQNLQQQSRRFSKTTLTLGRKRKGLVLR